MELILLIVFAVAVILFARFYTPKPPKEPENKKPKNVPVWMGAFSALGEAFTGIKKSPWPAALFVLAYVVIIAIEMSTIGLNPKNPDLEYFLKYAAFDTAFMLVFLLALPVYALAVADGKSIGIREALRFNLRKYLAIFVAGILFYLATAVSLLLFIVPAIWVIAWFALYEMPVIDKNLGPIRALKESRRLMLGHEGKAWGLIGASILLATVANTLSWIPVVGVQLASLAIEFVIVLSTVAAALLYRWAQKAQPKAA